MNIGGLLISAAALNAFFCNNLPRQRLVDVAHNEIWMGDAWHEDDEGI
jgi:hypothetical protein